MNNFYKKLVVILFFSFAFSSVNAQSFRVALEDMVTAIKNNRIQDVDKYMESFVTISINNNQSIYSHNQAQVVLHDFFEKNDPKDMLVMDSGSPNTTSSFVIGSYSLPDGTKYIVYVLMKEKNNKFIVQEMRVNKE